MLTRKQVFLINWSLKILAFSENRKLIMSFIRGFPLLTPKQVFLINWSLKILAFSENRKLIMSFIRGFPTEMLYISAYA